MKLKEIASAILMVCLSAGGYAESFREPAEREAQNRAQRADQQARRDANAQRRDRRDYRPPRAMPAGRPDHPGNSEQWRGRGAGPYHSFHRGGRLPPEYRSRHYVVDDWRGHRLRQPPRGYHWVQTGGDYVLAAIATGIILEIMLNN